MNRNRSRTLDKFASLWFASSFLLVFLSGCSLLNMLKPPENVLLKSLSIEGLTLTPAFDPLVQEYTAELPFAWTVKVAAESQVAGTTITGTGEVALTEHETLLTVANSKAGFTSSYKIRVTATETQDGDDFSTMLDSISGGNLKLRPEFSPLIGEYKLLVTNFSQQSIELQAKPHDSDASVLCPQIDYSPARLSVYTIICRKNLKKRVYKLTCIFSPSVSYSGNGNDDGEAPINMNGLEDDQIILPENTGGLTRKGYEFAGWNTSADGSGLFYKSGTTLTLGQNSITLYVQWKLAMISIPAGSFQRDANPLNISTISIGYKMSQCEISRDQFYRIFGVDPSDEYNFVGGKMSCGITDPVQEVSWYDAIAFCNKLSISEGLVPVYTITGVDFTTLVYSEIPSNGNASWDAVVATWTNSGYRLPTEMEWMWAAMGATSDRSNGYLGIGTNTAGFAKSYAGSLEVGIARADMGRFAWYSATSSGKTHPICMLLPNELGLYDMSGNVSEWCWDWYNTYPSGSVVSNSVDNSGRGALSGNQRVGRGGSQESYFCGVADRLNFAPAVQGYYLGFRVVQP